MSKKESSSKPGKDEDAAVAGPGDRVDAAETGADGEASQGTDEDSAGETGDGAKADSALASDSDSEFQADPDAKAGGESGSQADAADDSVTETGKDSAESAPSASDADKSPASEARAAPGSKDKAAPGKPPKAGPVKEKPARPRRSWFGLFNFLLIVGLAGGAYYYWMLEQQRLEVQRGTIADLENRLESGLSSKIDGSRLDSSLSSLKSEIDSLGNKVGELETSQQGLRESSETLYELFGRDRADWQLAEVEYLMRVAQHKLILENDFAGAAATLQAASDRIGLTGDPGLLPVRVTISEEIAELKTRERPDLVGMTLRLARLARQARTLTPGFAPRIDETSVDDGLPRVKPPEDWRDRVAKFIDSLVEVRHESTAPTEIEANVVNVGETLEDNLKLARWAVLDRDARQYAELIDQSLRLMREYYDLDNAANHEFMSELQTLQKMQLSPHKPDITGSLRQLQRILSQRENEPEAAPEAEGGEPVDG